MDTRLSKLEVEARQFERYGSEAQKRMRAQEQAGEVESAEHSRQAYSYCKQYAQQLRNMIDGLKKMRGGSVYFTKDGDNRYRVYGAPGCVPRPDGKR